MNGEPIDGSVLATLSLLRERTAERLVELFVRSAAEMLQELKGALAAGDAGRLADASHRLRGISANVGARRLSAHLARLAKAARPGTVPDDAVDPVEVIACNYEQAATALQTWSSQERRR